MRFTVAQAKAASLGNRVLLRAVVEDICEEPNTGLIEVSFVDWKATVPVHAVVASKPVDRDELRRFRRTVEDHADDPHILVDEVLRPLLEERQQLLEERQQLLAWREGERLAEERGLLGLLYEAKIALASLPRAEQPTELLDGIKKVLWDRDYVPDEPEDDE